MAIELLIYTAVALLVISRKGFLSCEFLALAFASLFHMPFVLFSVFHLEAIWGVPINSIFAIEAETLAKVPTMIVVLVSGVWAGHALRKRLFKQSLRDLAPGRVFRYVFYFTFFAALTVTSARLYSSIVHGYHSPEGGNVLFHPVADWLIVGTYLVFFAYRMESVRWRLTLRRAADFLPFVLLFFAGSRQASIAPFLAVLLLNAYIWRSGWFRYTTLALAALGIALLLPLVRLMRSEAGNVSEWSEISGIMGFFVEAGRTVRLVAWAREQCELPIGFGNYIYETFLRLFPFTNKTIQDLSLSVGGGGNGFSVLAEAHCVGGTGEYLWLLIVGALWGLALGFSRYDLRNRKGRLRIFLFVSLAIMWPRDELVGYIREMVWLALLIPVIVDGSLMRRARTPQSSTTLVSGGRSA